MELKIEDVLKNNQSDSYHDVDNADCATTSEQEMVVERFRKLEGLTHRMTIEQILIY